jgi:hypothetical protein
LYIQLVDYFLWVDSQLMHLLLLGDKQQWVGGYHLQQDHQWVGEREEQCHVFLQVPPQQLPQQQC